MKGGDDLLRVDVVARRLGLSVRKVQYMIARGELPAVLMDDKRRRGRRVRASDLDAYIAARPGFSQGM